MPPPRRRLVPAPTRASGDDWQPHTPAPSRVAASRAAAYAQLLDPVLAILGCAPGSAAATQLLRALLRTSDPTSLARGVASELDEDLFSTIRKCWIMVGCAATQRCAPPGTTAGPELAAQPRWQDFWHLALLQVPLLCSGLEAGSGMAPLSAPSFRFCTHTTKALDLQFAT